MEGDSIFTFNGCTIYDYDDHVLIKAPRGRVYEYSTIEGRHCFMFPGKFLNKYRRLFYNKRGDDDILYCMTISAALDD